MFFILPVFIALAFVSLAVGVLFLLYAVFVIFVAIGNGVCCLLKAVTNEHSSLWEHQCSDEELLKYINNNHYEFISRLKSRGWSEQDIYSSIAELDQRVHSRRKYH